APEQVQDPFDYDTRSDVYSFGLILLRCLMGESAGVEGLSTRRLSEICPRSIAEVIMRCISPRRKDRFGEATELFEALGKARGWSPRSGETAQGVSPGEDYIMTDLSEDASEGFIQQARALVDDGKLEEAVALLEQVTPGTAGLTELLDQVEERFRVSEELTNEALKLAEMGKTEEALDALGEAQSLWSESGPASVLKGDLGDGADGGVSFEPGRIPQPLKEAMELGKYSTVRAMLDRYVTEGPVTDDLLAVIAEFKQARVRTAILENVRAARKLYVQGHREEARDRWLEAARWLPRSTARERLRRVARHAERGELKIDIKKLPALAELQSRHADVAVQAHDLRAKLHDQLEEDHEETKRSRRRRLLLVLGMAAFIVVALATIVWGVLTWD
ncbi:MAG: hypothetical protein ACTSX8_07615, partial [Alphaproteobacteria bacterium]